MYRYTVFIQFPLECDWSKWKKAEKRLLTEKLLKTNEIIDKLNEVLAE